MGMLKGDDQSMYIGFDWDNMRWTGNAVVGMVPPQSDTLHVKGDSPPTDQDYQAFGSPHPAGCNFVFCDGSVRTIAFAIDPKVHQNLGNRQDGRVVKLLSP